MLKIYMEKLIYLDNAATTPVKREVFDKMAPYFCDVYANPSSAYTFAGKAKAAIDEAREIIAQTLNAETNEIYFTSGGSEADNWAIIGAARAYAKKNAGDDKRLCGHIITSKIEHHAILHTCDYLEKEGVEVTYIDVDENGTVDVKALEAAIREDTFLISIMFANNEIGTVQPIKKIGEIARKNNILFHTDAVQAYAHVPIDVNEMNIDMLSASGHKFNGPKGIGFLYIRNKVQINSLIHGGAQERSRRAGTSNTAGIVGMGEAARLAHETMESDANRVINIRDYLIERIEKEVPFTRVNGHRTDRLPNNVSFCFRFIEGESLLILLDQRGICGSSGSACSSGSLDPSHVLLAIGLPHEIAHGSLRLTLSEDTTKEDLDFVIDSIKDIVERLRSMSPLYEDYLKNN